MISFKYGTCAHSRLRGMIDIRENWVSELRDEGMVEVVKVNSSQNWADILTKCLRGSEFKRQLKMIQGELFQRAIEEEVILGNLV